MKIKASGAMISLLTLAAVFLSGCGDITVKRGTDRKPDFRTESAETEARTETPTGSQPECQTDSQTELEEILSMNPGQWKKVEVVNENIPEFDTENIKPGEWTEYAPMDGAGRSTCMTAVVHTVYPKAEAPCLTDFRPSGWHTVYYRIITDKDGRMGTNLMRRCHLLKPKLGGSCEDARNFFTGTCTLNFCPGMAEYEQQILDYLKQTDGYVLYRVRPRFVGDNALCHGVEMEAYSLDDDGEGVCFHVFVRNVQDGIYINYETGVSHMLRDSGTKE